jgi:hypothetical protein
MWHECRILTLREVVVPQKEKEDQAAFLRSAAEYIRQLQVRSCCSGPYPCSEELCIACRNKAAL